MDNVVRLYLEHLSNPELAFAIVRRTASSAAAQMVASYCQQQSNWAGAIEFLLMGKRGEVCYWCRTLGVQGGGLYVWCVSH
jgi:WD repeat-containing protein 19